MTDAEILGHFESLGDNCEFGLVQRLAGFERLGFFRLNYARMPALLTALDSDFADVDQRDRVEIFTEPSQELMVRIRDYGFQYHTQMKLGEIDVETLRTQQIKAIRFLARKLMDDLRAAEKVFVRKGADSMGAEHIAPLLRALRRYGPVTLLWVVPQDQAHLAGSVEVVEPGLLKGYIDRFAPTDDAHDFSLAWADVCRGALRLWRDDSPAGTVIENRAKPVGSNLIRHANGFGGSEWWQAPHATAQLSNEVPRLDDACAVTEHTLTEATRGVDGVIHGRHVPHGLSPGSSYVASIWVWLPTDFRGAFVGAVFRGFPSVHLVNAETTLRGTWQRLWVTARIPAGLSSASPSLLVTGPAGTRLFSTCWKLEIGAHPTAYDPADLPPAALRSAAPATADAGRLSPIGGSAMADLVPPARPTTNTAADRGRIGRTLLRLPSPAFSLAPPELYNRELIPPAWLKPMEHSWFRGDFPGRDVVFSLVEDAIVVGDGLVFTDDLRLVRASFTNHKADEIERAREAVARARRNGGPPERSGTYVLCKKNGTRNYGHWLMEMFPKAALVRQHFADTGMWFIVPAPGGRLDAVITDSMQSLGVGPERLLRAGDQPVRIERLLLVEGLTEHGGYMSPLVIPAVRRLAAGIAPGPHRRLYIPREGTKRNFVDAAAVQARAEASGHVPFDPGNADLATQIATFAGAGRVVGLMGAGLTNIVFAPDGAEIVVLAPGGMPDTFFWFLARLCGHRHIEVRCPVEGDFEGIDAWRHQVVHFPQAQAGIVFPPIEPARTAPPAVVSGPAGRVYRPIGLADLVTAGVAQVTPYLPASVVEVPRLLFGETDARQLGLDERVPPGAAGTPLRHPPIGAYVLRDVAVHTHWGVVTHGDTVLAETTSHLPIHIMPGVEKVGETGLRLPDWPVAATLPSAYDLLYSNLDNYFHWVLEAIPRFNNAEFHGYGVLDEVDKEICLLAPPLDTPWKRQSYELFVPPGLRTHVMANATTVRVERLIYIPLLSGGGLMPHRALLAVFDRARAAAFAVLQVAPAAPWRRLFVSRADSKARVLVNEAEIAALAATAGFETVVLSSISVAEQVRLFAEASHIIAPHGAGLTNLLFCRPGAAVCELHMDLYLHWAFRRLAALRGLRYGCLVGAHVPPRKPAAHGNTWRLEPSDLAAVLADPRFIGG